MVYIFHNSLCHNISFVANNMLPLKGSNKHFLKIIYIYMYELKSSHLLILSNRWKNTFCILFIDLFPLSALNLFWGHDFGACRSAYRALSCLPAWVNPLRPLRSRSASTEDEVMACCQTAPRCYLNRCWLIIGEVLWYSHEGNFVAGKRPGHTLKIRNVRLPNYSRIS